MKNFYSICCSLLLVSLILHQSAKAQTNDCFSHLDEIERSIDYVTRPIFHAHEITEAESNYYSRKHKEIMSTAMSAESQKTHAELNKDIKYAVWNLSTHVYEVFENLKKVKNSKDVRERLYYASATPFGLNLISQEVRDYLAQIGTSENPDLVKYGVKSGMELVAVFRYNADYIRCELYNL